MKKAKKLLVILLTLAMCLSLVPAAAFADKPVYKVVAVGDSTCVGLGLDDFGIYSKVNYAVTPAGQLENHGAYTYGFLSTESKSAYPMRLVNEYLAAKMPGYDIEFTNLGINGIRAKEILAVINGDRVTDHAGQGLLNSCYTSLQYLADLEYGGKDISELFREEIQSADLITLDCIMNSFSWALGERVLARAFGSEEERANYPENLADIADRLAPGVKSASEKIRKSFVDTFGTVIPPNMVTDAADAVVYTFCDFCVSFSELVQRIRELNSDATILVGGSYNPFQGLSLTYKGLELDFSGFVSAFLSLADLYITGMAPERNEYLFIDLPEDIELFMDSMAAEEDYFSLSPEFLSHVIDNTYCSYVGTAALPLCEKAVARAQARGIDTAGYGLIYPETVVAAFEDVRSNGDSAGAMNKVLVEVWGAYINNILNGMKTKKLDAEGMFEALDSNYGEVMFALSDTPYSEMTDKDKALLFISADAGVREGIGVHFSAKGCALKYELAVKTLEEGRSAQSSIKDIQADAAKQTESALKNTVCSSILGVIRNAMSSIDFTAFFASIAENIQQFFIKIIPAR